MRPLPHPNNLHLQAAEGWLELGNHLEANEELEKIEPSLRVHPSVLEVRLDIYDKAKKWEACVELAGALVELTPDNREVWIRRSFALHVLKRTQTAHDCLLPAAEKFPECWNIAYNLACYCSQLRDFEASQSWFKKAIVLNEKEVQRAALDDPDLEPLWASMSTTLWKRTV